jgi:hypothetical protein
MAYNKFTLEKVTEQFGLTIVEKEAIFPKTEVEPSQILLQILDRNLLLAKGIATEKAFSELIVSPILVEMRELTHRKISLFSGIDFTIDVHQGLSGRCDFIISLNENQFFLTAPVIALVEAKKGVLQDGYGQCTAEMIAAQLFNERKGLHRKRIYGVVTNGLEWQMMSLENKTVAIENRVLSLDKLNEILGVLLKMTEENI